MHLSSLKNTVYN